MSKLVWLKFYPDAWLADEGVRSCSFAARGLWADLIAVAAKCDPRGYVRINGRACTPAQIARMVGGDVSEVEALLTELDDAGVLSRDDDDGAIYSRRIVRDEAKRRKCSAAGRKGGGNPTLKRDDKGEGEGTLGSTYKGDNEDKALTSTFKGASSTLSSNLSLSESAHARFPDYVCDKLVGLYPKSKRGGRVLARRVLRDALELVADREGLKPAEASEWLADRIADYAASDTGRSQFALSLERWLADGCYDQDLDEWARADAADKPKAAPALSYGLPAEAAQIRDSRKRGAS